MANRSKLGRSYSSNPTGLRSGDLSRRRIFNGLSYTQSAVFPTKHNAQEMAKQWRNFAKVRVIKVADGWAVYTR